MHASPRACSCLVPQHDNCHVLRRSPSARTIENPQLTLVDLAQMANGHGNDLRVGHVSADADQRDGSGRPSNATIKDMVYRTLRVRVT